MDEQRVAGFYDAVGDTYDRTLYFLACDPLYELEIARLMAGWRPRRVLDLGCGTGKQLVLLAPRAEDVWGIDISAESLRQAEGRCVRAGLTNVRLFQQSIEQLPAEDGSVDAIFSYGDVISHLHDSYPRVFRECGRVLRPGGILSFEADGKWELDMFLHNPEERARARATRRVGHLRIWRDIPCKTFTHGELSRALREAGLELFHVRGVNILHCLLPERILMGLPDAAGPFFRAVSAVLQRIDRTVGCLPWFYRIASTRLTAARKV